MFNPIRIEYITKKIKKHLKIKTEKTNFLKGFNILNWLRWGLISEPMARLGQGLQV